MTPPAAAGHARALRRTTSSPRGPRRVSGPARTPKGREAGATAAARQAASAAPRGAAPRPAAKASRATAAAPRTARRTAAQRARAPRGGLVAALAPRRVSGPVGGAVALPRPGVARRRPAARREGLAPAALRRLGALPESPWLDRLLKGRLWIGIIAVGLIGLVFMQVSLLKINAGMGRAVERSAVLERENASLSADVARLDANDRIQRWALDHGMSLPAAGGVRYLGAHGRRVGGDAPQIPAEATATTATLPTLPADGTAGAASAAPPATTDLSGANGPITTTAAPAGTATGTAAPASGAAPSATATSGAAAAAPTGTGTAPATGVAAATAAPATTGAAAAATAAGTATATAAPAPTGGVPAGTGGAAPTAPTGG